ncbi:MAG: hypothetical protein ABII93_01665 [Chrysiogenia bacterium]
MHFPKLRFSSSTLPGMGMFAGGTTAVRFRTAARVITGECLGISYAGWELFLRCVIMAEKLLKFFYGMGNDEKKFRKNPDRG